MINMQVIGHFRNRYNALGELTGEDLVPSEKPGEALLALEKEADKNYDAFVLSVPDENKLSKSQFKTGGIASVDPRKLRLDDDDKAGIKGISEATGFSRTTVLNFYALSLSSGLVRDMREFVSTMIGEPTQTYGHLKNGLSEKEGAKILSTLA